MIKTKLVSSREAILPGAESSVASAPDETMHAITSECPRNAADTRKIIRHGASRGDPEMGRHVSVGLSGGVMAVVQMSTN